MKTRKMFMWLVVMVGVLAGLSACSASVDTSKAYSRGVIQQGGIVRAEQLRVAEYLNYYEQHFAKPVDTALGLDLRSGNPQIPAGGGEAWLQIGIQARVAQNADIAPLNLALVIDRSGSMDASDKMPYLKQALRVFLQSLAANDIVAIVVYGTNAEVILPAQEVGDGRWIATAIDRLQPGGTTNLHAGLMLGFREVDRNYSIRRNNRVILLTDGIANQGETNPNRIAADAKVYNDRGVYLSTIGLGRDFNDALLISLANQGKGAYHFIDSAEEMDKVFRKEVTGLVEKVASEVSITIRPGSGMRLIGLTGYDGQLPTGPVEVRQRDMGTGDSQVLLAHLEASPSPGGQRLLATVELRYKDVTSQRDEIVTAPAYAIAGPSDSFDPLWDLEVLRNVTIQHTAEGLKEIDRLYQARRYRDAWDLARQLEQNLRRVAGLTKEDQMAEDADMLSKYQATLAEWVESETGRLPLASEATGEAREGRGGRQMLPSPGMPVVDVK